MSTPRLIPLGNGHYAICDEEDWPLLARYTWRLSETKNGKAYARCPEVGYMHRLLMNPGESEVVDHINACGLDNRRANLRVCSQSENLANIRKSTTREMTSKHKGVSWNEGRQRWVARLVKDGKVFQRYCTTEREAALTYNALAALHYGEYARPNVIDDDESKESKSEKIVRSGSRPTTGRQDDGSGNAAGQDSAPAGQDAREREPERAGPRKETGE